MTARGLVVRSSLTVSLLLVSALATASAPVTGPMLRNSGQSLGDCRTFGLELADLDGDGDLDVFLNCYLAGNRVLLNDGAGVFTDSGQSLGGVGGHGLALGDLDGDGDVDAFIVNNDPENPFDQVFVNDGAGRFTDTGQRLGAVDDWGLVAWLADLDGDGDLDGLAGNYEHPNRTYFNDGCGTFTAGEPPIGGTLSRDMPPADVDGDGNVDLYLTNARAHDRVLLNDGHGNFIDSGQALGSTSGFGFPRLGDLEGDGDPDVFVPNSEAPSRVLLNDGRGRFRDSGQALGRPAMHVSLADLDGDGALDAVTAHQQTGLQVWLNDGAGAFTAALSFPEETQVFAVRLGDVDGDGDSDVVLGKGEGIGGNALYIHD